ncbi:MAG: tail fiber domain-containing protein [Ferruginibacter sp.]
MKKYKITSFIFVFLFINYCYGQPAGLTTAGTPVYTTTNALTINSVYVGKGNTNGTGCTALGAAAMNGGSTPAASNGNNNTALGYATLYTLSGTGAGGNTAPNNTAVGEGCLYTLNSNSLGGNTGSGVNCMVSLTDGNSNVAMGISAMYNSTSTSSNCAIGASALRYGQADENTAVGFNAMQGTTNITGANNAAFGSNSLLVVSSGANNAGMGYRSLYAATSGGFNSALGSNALSGVTTGSHNVGIGDAAAVPSNTADDQLSIQNVIYGVSMNSSNACIGINQSSGFGYTSGASLTYGIPSTPSNFKLSVNGWTASTAFVALSDERLKKDIRKIESPIEKISRISGYTYNWNKEFKTTRQLDDNRQAGFLAQEILKVLPEAVVKAADGVYGLNYNAIMPLLAEGIKVQQSQIEQLQLKVADQDAAMTELRNRINQLTPGNAIVQKDNFNVTPNPVTGSSIISYAIDANLSNAMFIVYDLQGKMLKKYTVTHTGEGQLQINKKEFGNGMYILSLISNNNEIQSKHFLIVD